MLPKGFSSNFHPAQVAHQTPAAQALPSTTHILDLRKVPDITRQSALLVHADTANHIGIRVVEAESNLVALSTLVNLHGLATLQHHPREGQVSSSLVTPLEVCLNTVHTSVKYFSSFVVLTFKSDLLILDITHCCLFIVCSLHPSRVCSVKKRTERFSLLESVIG